MGSREGDAVGENDGLGVGVPVGFAEGSLVEQTPHETGHKTESTGIFVLT